MNWMRIATGLMMILLSFHGLVAAMPEVIVGDTDAIEEMNGSCDVNIKGGRGTGEPGDWDTDEPRGRGSAYVNDPDLGDKVELDPGIPLVEGNRLMYITIDNTSEMRIELFLDPVAMGPPEGITLELPVLTEPSAISIRNVTADEFRASHDLGHLERVAKRQSGVGNAISSGLSDYPATFFGSMFLPAGFMYLVDTDEGHPYDYYDGSDATSFTGTSIELDSVMYNGGEGGAVGSPGTTGSSGPHDPFPTDRTLLVNFTTTSPISDREYIDLTENYPEVMRNLTEFVRTTKSQYIRWYDDEIYAGYYRVDQGLRNITNDFDARSTELNQSYGVPISSTYGYRYSLNKLLALLYGYGEITGTALTFTLPIEEGSLLIPLVRSFLNESIDPESRLELVINADDSLSLDLDEDPDWEVFDDGRHYSHFTLNTSLNTSGLSMAGSIEDDSEYWNERSHRFNGYLYTNRFPLLLVVFTIGIFLAAYSVFVIKFDRELQWKDWRLVVPLATATLLGTVFGGFTISLLLCMLGFHGSFYSRNNLKILLGPAADDIPGLTLRDRAFRPLWGVAIVIAGLFFFISLMVFVAFLFGPRTGIVAFLLSTSILALATGALWFSYGKNRRYGPGILDPAQKMILTRIMPAYATQSPDGQGYAVSILAVAFVVIPMSLLAAATSLFWLIDNVNGWVVFSLSLSFSILVNGYLLIKLRDIEEDRKHRHVVLYNDTLEAQPEIEDHISWVKWLGPNNLLKLMQVPTQWDDQTTWIYTLNNPQFTCPFNCQPDVQRNVTCRITWEKLYSALKFPEKYVVAHSIGDGSRILVDSS